jgi:hypothetical protein
MAQEWSEDQLKWYDKQGKARPTHISHGVNADELHEHMRQLKPHKWRLHGNMLEGETDMGMLVQRIPTDYILEKTDDNGLPVFRKIEL